jgi:hypothetical protein
MRTLGSIVFSILLLAVPEFSLATPAPDGQATVPGDPELCTTEPRPWSFYEPYLGTPGALTSPDTRTPATPIPVSTPEGDQVDANTYESVVALLTQYNACATAGNPASVSAIMTDSAARRFVENFGADFVSAEHPESHATNLFLLFAVEQPDGTVIAVVASEDTDAPSERAITQVFHLVREGSAWKIDDIQVLGVATPDASQECSHEGVASSSLIDTRQMPRL